MMDTQGPAAIRTGDISVPLDLRQPGQKFTLTVRGERDPEEHSVDVELREISSTTSVWATYGVD